MKRKKNKWGVAVDGHSLKPFLENPATQNWDGSDVAMTIRASWKSKKIEAQQLAVRSKDFRYIHYCNGAEELYNHANDPHEWNNLAENPEYAAKKAQLKQKMFAMLPESTDEKMSTEAWKDQFFKDYPQADANKDGELSWPEYQAFKKKLDAAKAKGVNNPEQIRNNNEWKDNFFKKYPDADTDQDGVLS